MSPWLAVAVTGAVGVIGVVGVTGAVGAAADVVGAAGVADDGGYMGERPVTSTPAWALA